MDRGLNTTPLATGPGTGTVNFLFAIFMSLYPGFLVGNGFYNPSGASMRATVIVALLFLIVSFLALSALLMLPSKIDAIFGPRPTLRLTETFLIVSIGLCADTGFSARTVAAGAAVLLLLIPERVRGIRTVDARFWAMFAVGAAMAAGPIFAHAKPSIDVFHVLESGGRMLASGQNPYAHAIPVAGETVPSLFTYFPAALLFTLPGALAGDPRIMTLAGIVGAALLLRLLLRNRDTDAARLLPLFLLFNPSLLSVIDNAWLEPAILFFGALSLVLMASGRRIPAGIALAGFVAVKQLLLPMLAFFARSGNKGFRIALWAAAATALLCAPFLIWAPKHFIDNTFLFYIMPGAVKGHVPPMHLSQTLNTVYHAYSGRDLSGAVRWGAAGAIFIVALWRQPKGVYGALLAGTVFLLGLGIMSTFAFMNYYNMIQGLLVLCAAAAVCEKDGNPLLS